MAYEVRLAKRAINDLRHIYKTIEADTSEAADVWFRALESAIFSLETHPARGAVATRPPRPRIRETRETGRTATD
jgi:plasmid stabilization system protein ParE